jgi:hypothetical protein
MTQHSLLLLICMTSRKWSTDTVKQNPFVHLCMGLDSHFWYMVLPLVFFFYKTQCSHHRANRRSRIILFFLNHRSRKIVLSQAWREVLRYWLCMNWCLGQIIENSAFPKRWEAEFPNYRNKFWKLIYLPLDRKQIMIHIASNLLFFCCINIPFSSAYYFFLNKLRKI